VRRRRFGPRAFTLLELLLTLAVLAAIASVAIPQVSWVLGDRRLVRAADQVRIEMTRLRVDAMRGGRVLMMQGSLDDRQLRIRPYVSLADATEALDQTGSQSALLSGARQGTVTVAATESVETEEIIELPEEITIGAVAVVSAARAAEIEQQTLAEQADGWSQPILFYPDGTTSTAAVTLRHPTHGNVTVKLRGITGDVTTGEVMASET
jgi:prepilin-type N-terminal cleavage/methylation domain-containing protein